MKSATTKLITKVYSFMDTVDFENKDSFDQFSEYLSNLQDKQIELKEINSKIEEFITDNTILETQVQNNIDYNERYYK